MSNLGKRRLLLILCLLAVAAALIAPPIPQDPHYHDFADARALAALPNALNILSNGLFLWIGIEGLLRLLRFKSLRIAEPLLGAYAIFFLSLILIALGSSHYHWAPDNASLAWDRAAMVIAFMSFFTIVLCEQTNPSSGRWMLPLLIAAGLATILYWHYSELAGRGDLRPYAIVQFLPMLLIPIILLLFKRSYTRSSDIWWMLAWYVVAKGCELLDEEIFAVTGFVSGHSLKHLTAGIACFIYLRHLRLREIRAA